MQTCLRYTKKPSHTTDGIDARKENFWYTKTTLAETRIVTIQITNHIIHLWASPAIFFKKMNVNWSSGKNIFHIPSCVRLLVSFLSIFYRSSPLFFPFLGFGWVALVSIWSVWYAITIMEWVCMIREKLQLDQILFSNTWKTLSKLWSCKNGNPFVQCSD